eukprot:CAMPEP_0203663180 /NCGR_PEP_ID=MMETSP0090-20130426/867_1 /ASSEMBLY_ACC=CAM_ASM_001088 /TAXON_ID=426623 /ORGANISM="Chaetoceros affinis, Strain CCMP159" /LENGTH=175 /DNA_ID=CAMNT_0050526055 /DNA_START=96 /DNA_END=623 /DNA_ORIENTATION=-
MPRRNSSKSLISHLPKSNVLSQNSSPLAPPQRRSDSELKGIVSDFLNTLENIPEGTPDQVAGAFIIFCAAMPHFLPEGSSVDKKNSKKIFTTLGLTLTSIQFTAFMDQISIGETLQNDYIACILFCIAATINLGIEKRQVLSIPFQLQHLLAMGGFTADALISPQVVHFVSQTFS